MTSAGGPAVLAMTISLSMSALMLFPMPFLKSFAYAAIAVVALTVAAAIMVTPAAIAALGDRSIFGFAPVPAAVVPPAPTVEQIFFYRSTHS